MSNTLQVSISQILNWTVSDSNIMVQIRFQTLDDEELTHKCFIGHLEDGTLSINGKFRMQYCLGGEQIVCKVSVLKEDHQFQILGKITMNLEVLDQQKLLFFGLNGTENILKVECLDREAEEDEEYCFEEEQLTKESFLQSRLDFLEETKRSQFRMKKNFTDKVQNLLINFKEANLNDASLLKNTAALTEKQQIYQNQRQEMMDKAIERKIFLKRIQQRSSKALGRTRCHTDGLMSSKMISSDGLSIVEMRGQDYNVTSMPLIHDINQSEEVFSYEHSPEDEEYHYRQ